MAGAISEGSDADAQAERDKPAKVAGIVSCRRKQILGRVGALPLLDDGAPIFKVSTPTLIICFPCLSPRFISHETSYGQAVFGPTLLAPCTLFFGPHIFSNATSWTEGMRKWTS